jgi:hypothetical protein
MTYGRELKLPIDQVLQGKKYYENLNDYFSVLLKRTSFAQDLAKARMIDRAARLEEQQTDLQYRIDYKFGERVYMFVPDTKTGLTNKMRSRWHGPYQILMRIGLLNYRIMRRLEDNTIETRLVNVRRLKPYTEPNQLAQAAQRIAARDNADRYDADSSADDDDDEHQNEPSQPPDDEYEVEEIRGKRLYRGKVQYLVKWAGFNEKENTWEPLENLVNSEAAVQEFESVIQDSNQQPEAEAPRRKRSNYRHRQ